MKKLLLLSAFLVVFVLGFAAHAVTCGSMKNCARMCERPGHDRMCEPSGHHGMCGRHHGGACTREGKDGNDSLAITMDHGDDHGACCKKHGDAAGEKACCKRP